MTHAKPKPQPGHVLAGQSILAQLDAHLRLLEDENAQLRTALARLELEHGELRTQIERMTTRKAPGGRPCPYCDRDQFQNAHALGIHIGRMHREKVRPADRPAPAPAATTPRPAPATRSPRADGWACASCGKGEIAQSVKRPDLCLICNAQSETMRGRMIG